MEKNEFEEICESLEREYLPENGNRFRYAKDYLKTHIGNNYDLLKSTHAEAMDKIGDTYDKYLSVFTLIVSVFSFIVAAFSLIIAIVNGKSLVVVFLIIGYLILLIIISLLFVRFINASKSVSHWQKYVVEALEDLIQDQKEKVLLDQIHKKLDFSDQLFNQLDSVEKVDFRCRIRKIFQKK